VANFGRFENKVHDIILSSSLRGSHPVVCVAKYCVITDQQLLKSNDFQPQHLDFTGFFAARLLD